MPTEKPLSPAAERRAIARRAKYDAERAAYVRKIVDSFPPLTDAQKAYISGLLWPTSAPVAGAARPVEPRPGTRQVRAEEPLPRTFYTPREVAASTGLSYKKVLAMCSEGRLRHIREGQSIRIPLAALDELQARAV